MQWIKYTPLVPPPQGLKVICFKDGDCWIAYCFKKEGKIVWMPCVPSEIIRPHLKYKWMSCDTPEFWSYIDFESIPGNYTGYLRIKREGDDFYYILDDIETIDKEVYDDFIKAFLP